jgi:hypothetical protein
MVVFMGIRPEAVTIGMGGRAARRLFLSILNTIRTFLAFRSIDCPTLEQTLAVRDLAGARD